mmetsp:Transcript_6410/g.13121  ORF Transcript_6410/g.13121 Transcript_6410/m.13121 type:complete len:510 (+) Transcript_6410:42-1571(+)
MALAGARLHFLGKLSAPPGVLCARVERNGGACSLHLGPHLTHVVVGRGANAVKLRAAQEAGVALVDESWLDAALSANNFRLVDPAAHAPPVAGARRPLDTSASSVDGPAPKRAALSAPDAAAPAVAPAPVVRVAGDDLADGDSVEVAGSGSSKYLVKNVGGLFSCTCPSWRIQSSKLDVRSCKHIARVRGTEREAARVQGATAVAAMSKRVAASAAPTRGGGVRMPLAASDETSAGRTSPGPALLLAHNWKEGDDYTGWWLSEKLDGVRALWTGSRFLSRQGNQYIAPTWFVRGLPRDEELDGELFVGRGEFQRCVSIVRRLDAGEEWNAVTFCVFDLCTPLRRSEPFEARWARLQTLLERAPSHVRLHPQVEVTGPAHVTAELEKVQAWGGEGLMLRRPGSAYETGRSQTLLKVKTFTDEEARVVGHEPGKGKHLGRLGALLCVDRAGATFKIGTGFSDGERDVPPAVGSIISFKYQERTKAGVPRFPVYLRLRPDISGGDFLSGVGP